VYVPSTTHKFLFVCAVVLQALFTGKQTKRGKKLKKKKKKLPIEVRVLSRGLQVAAPSRVAVDVDIGRPAVKPKVRDVVRVILPDVGQPQGTQLAASHRCHRFPQSAIEGGALVMFYCCHQKRTSEKYQYVYF